LKRKNLKHCLNMQNKDYLVYGKERNIK